MTNISRNSRMDLSIDVSWHKDGVTHQEHFFADHINCWRDIFPGSILEKLFDAHDKGHSLALLPGELVAPHSHRKVHVMPLGHLREMALLNGLRRGRYYPQGMIPGLPGVFKENIVPCRCVDVTDRHVTVDLNHPMAGVAATLTMAVHKIHPESTERGGSCTDWLDLALTGPGMQARHNGMATDFFFDDAFHRRDETPDSRFYENDRFVHHIDRQAREHLTRLYAGLIQPGDAVLDLMAGWASHLPGDLDLASVHGIGLNENELKQNTRLSRYGVQDLNLDPFIDVEDNTFDAAVCSLSVEYLIDPGAVFKEVARVLKPGGLFVVTFSNRWFPEKAIQVWEELHDFERMGLVSEYFKRSEAFDSLSTRSIRGYPRPDDDRYSSQLRLSDPIYAVMGRSMG